MGYQRGQNKAYGGYIPLLSECGGAITPTNDGSDIEEDENYRDRDKANTREFYKREVMGLIDFEQKTSSLAN